MVDAVNTQTIVDGSRNVVIKAINLSDGTGESAVTKVDVSALNGSPTSVKITRLHYDIQGMAVNILWDADTDVSAIIIGNGQGTLDFNSFGGLINNAGTGVTGDIKFTTIGHTANDSYSIVLEMKKS